MSTIHVNIVSAEESIFEGEAAMVFAPAEMGEVGILPQHSPFLTRLKAGQVRVQTENGEEQHFFVSGGLLEVQPQVVSVLADTLLRARELDAEAASQAKSHAEELLSGEHGEADFERAREQLMQAEAQLRMIQELRGEKRGG